jgi:hypothetical protein
MEDFLEALISAIPQNNKALLNWSAMWVSLRQSQVISLSPAA